MTIPLDVGSGYACTTRAVSPVNRSGNTPRFGKDGCLKAPLCDGSMASAHGRSLLWITRNLGRIFHGSDDTDVTADTWGGASNRCRRCGTCRGLASVVFGAGPGAAPSVRAL